MLLPRAIVYYKVRSLLGYSGIFILASSKKSFLVVHQILPFYVNLTILFLLFPYILCESFL